MALAKQKTTLEHTRHGAAMARQSDESKSSCSPRKNPKFAPGQNTAQNVRRITLPDVFIRADRFYSGGPVARLILALIRHAALAKLT